MWKINMDGIALCTVCGQGPASVSPGGLLNMQHLSPVPVMDAECAFEQHPMSNIDLIHEGYLISVTINISNVRTTTEILTSYYICIRLLPL